MKQSRGQANGRYPAKVGASEDWQQLLYCWLFDSKQCMLWMAEHVYPTIQGFRRKHARGGGRVESYPLYYLIPTRVTHAHCA